MSIKVKICGITNLADAEAASAAGADYLGFVLWPRSKRAVPAATVREIARQLRRRERRPLLVGVFVDETAEKMAQMLDECGLDLAQLSGDEPPALVGDAASPLYGRSYKALRPATVAEAEVEAEWYLPPQPAADRPALLLDTYHPTLPGGTGQTSDWSVAARLAQTVPGNAA
jgi:phosphoribosylanthranilate isomerase